jgi:hypothetical protein
VTIRSSSTGSRLLIPATIAMIVAIAALLGTIGADSRWLAAMGDVIAHRGSVPAGIPFASAASSHWPNAIVLAELAFAGLEHLFGDRGLLLAQLLAVAGALIMLARDARAGGAEGPGVCGALLLAAFGAASSLVIVRVQLFSLLLFPVLVALLRSQARRPTNAIWLVVPLLALWANLHGAVLLGLAVTFAYLGISRLRLRPAETLAIGAASLVALCLTPALLSTPDYYHGLLTNLAASRGAGMWAPLSLTSPLDVALVIAAIALVACTRRSHATRWELVVGLALTVLTVQGSRNGVWLLMFLMPLAARTIVPRRQWAAVAPVALLASSAAVALAVARGPEPNGASPRLVSQALALAHGSPVLAEDQLAEQVALSGGRIFAGDPIDAFSRTTQATYLDWNDGDASGRRALDTGVRVVLVVRGSRAQTLTAQTAGFHLIATSPLAALYERGPGSGDSGKPATRARPEALEVIQRATLRVQRPRGE